MRGVADRVLRPRPNERYNLRAVRAPDADRSSAEEASDDSVTENTKEIKSKVSLIDGSTWSNIFSFHDVRQAALGSRVCRMARLYAPRRVTVFLPNRAIVSLATGNFVQKLQPYSMLACVSFSDCKGFGDADALRMAELPMVSRLRGLDLGSTSITTVGFEALSAKLSGLCDLRLTHLKRVSIRAVTTLLAKCPDLKRLDVGATYMDDEGLIAVATLCPKLAFLDLSLCPASDAGMVVAARSLPQLESLRIPTAMTDDGMTRVARCLPKLSALAIVRSEITDDGFVEAISSLPELRILHVVDVQTITDDGFAGVSTILPLLHTFILRSPSDLVTDVGLCHLIRNCTSLKSLRLRDVPGVTDIFLESLAFNMKCRGDDARIESLDFRAVDRLTADTLVRVIDRTPSITNVVISNCRNIPVSEMRRIQMVSYRNHVILEATRKRRRDEEDLAAHAMDVAMATEQGQRPDVRRRLF